MNSEEYREQIRRRVEQELAEDQNESVAAESLDQPDGPEELLQVLGDAKRTAEERRAALQALQQLSFDPASFAPIRPAFIETLRKIIEDPDERLREMALEILAQERDEYAQRRLLAGLRGDEKRLISDDRAIQFLGYDIHAEHYPILRRLAQESDNPVTRREAVKALSSDTESADLLLDIYGNKSEDDDVRRASASALLSVDPVRFEERAKEAVVDDSDAESVRAASLTALTYYANSAIASDHSFVERVAKVETRTPELAGMGEESAAATSDEIEEGALAKAVRLFQSRYGVR